MRSALVIGYGQIGEELADQLSAAGIHTTVATRSGQGQQPALEREEVGGVAGAESTGRTRIAGSEITRIRTDAGNPKQLLAAASGSDVIFACTHAPYDSRQWVRVLPHLESTIMDVARELDIPVIFPESVYAFAGLSTPITEASPFAPAEEKGRIRQQLMEARAGHGARTASVAAGDLIGRTAQPGSSVVRLCISDRIRRGRRAVVPARIDVPHGVTVIADLAAAMISAAHSDDADPAGGHRFLLAPASNPTLAEVADFTHHRLGTPARKPFALPRWVTRAAGIVDRSMLELNELSPIWYEPCVIETGDFAESLGTTRWQEAVTAMLE